VRREAHKARRMGLGDESLPQVQMPNRRGFSSPDPRPDVPRHASP
jgi:hypothetical protein